MGSKTGAPIRLEARAGQAASAHELGDLVTCSKKPRASPGRHLSSPAAGSGEPEQSIGSESSNDEKKKKVINYNLKGLTGHWPTFLVWFVLDSPSSHGLQCQEHGRQGQAWCCVLYVAVLDAPVTKLGPLGDKPITVTQGGGRLRK